MMYSSIVGRATIADVLRLAGITLPADTRKLVRCPLHDDETPSLRVFERGYRCFGCGRDGRATFPRELSLRQCRQPT